MYIPLRSRQENLFCKFNKVIITISLNLVDFDCENYFFRKSYTHVAVISAYFESKLPRSRTSKLIRIQNIRIVMNDQTVRLVSTFGSGSCVSSFGLTQKWKLQTCFQFLGHFHFWACTGLHISRVGNRHLAMNFKQVLNDI